MLHNTKLLMRRLAYVPWLLAAGLVLGWAGEAVANVDDDHATQPRGIILMPPIPIGFDA